MNIEPPLTFLGILLLFLAPSAVVGNLKPEAFKNPGGWKFPKAEVMGVLSAIAALGIMAGVGMILLLF